MIFEHPYAHALFAILGFGIAGWLVSLFRNDVSFVDGLWSLFFLAAAAAFAVAAQPLGTRAWLVVILLTMWSLRLSVYITARNWGRPEDYRYRSIRANNEPGFAFKSLYIVFGLQGLLAWIVALPLWPAIDSAAPINIVDGLALLLWLIGFAFEAGGDWQLARFRRSHESQGRVLDTGLWRCTRHPNYFGDFCIWWSFYLFAVAAGAWWTIVSPLLMSLLLLKVSGVAMLERTIESRRPAYAEYASRTNAFFPGPRRPGSTLKEVNS